MAIDLYKLFPWIIKYRDELASAGTGEDPNLKRITYMLEQEFEVTEAEIEGLATILNVDSCDPDYLLYLSLTLGTAVAEDPNFTTTELRWLVRNLVNFYKIKGTRPSWHKHFGWLHQLGRFEHWYSTWELWKRIPYTINDYWRTREYLYGIRAARFDLSYVDAEGNTVFLTPSQMNALFPYIKRVCPVHVIPRQISRTILMTDTLEDLTDATEIFTPPLPTQLCESSCEVSCELMCQLGSCEGNCEEACQAGTCETDCETPVETDFVLDEFVPPVREDELVVDVTCVSSCETGSCEGWCELNCQLACQFVCQGGCQFGIESVSFPDCKASCETGGCEGDCQVGSCQGGCEACVETEKFPAHIESYAETGVLSARIWFPYPGMTKPPTDGVLNTWWITPSGSPINLGFDQVGTAMFPPSIDGVGYAIPFLHESKWVEVRCIKPEEFSEVSAVLGNAVNAVWEDKLALQPHPCSIRIEAELATLTTTAVGNVIAGVWEVGVVDSTGFQVGDEVQIYDDSHGETSRITSIDAVAHEILLEGGLVHSYTAPVTLYRKAYKQVAINRTMEEPVVGPPAHWISHFEGDVDVSVPTTDRQADYRPDGAGGYPFKVTFKRPPPVGATITLFYIKEKDCSYWLEETIQSLDPYTLAVDLTTRDLGFRKGNQPQQVWVWNDESEQWEWQVGYLVPFGGDDDDILQKDSDNDGAFSWNPPPPPPEGTVLNPPTLPPAPEGTETADNTTWNRDAQAVGEQGVIARIHMRSVYNEAGDEKLYGFYRTFTYDDLGILRDIGVEIRYTIDTPVDCP